MITEILDTEYSYDMLYPATGEFFMTCDNPIITIEPHTDANALVGTGFGRHGTEVVFPLNQRACIILSCHEHDQSSGQ